MTALDRSRLRELAEKATPGPWRTDRNVNSPWVYSVNPTGTLRDSLLKCASVEDGAYIAAASPSTVIALLDECDRLRAMLHDTHGFLRGVARRPELGRDAVDLVEQADAIRTALETK